VLHTFFTFLITAFDNYNAVYGFIFVTLVTMQDVELVINWGPIYKISYDNLTIILR